MEKFVAEQKELLSLERDAEVEEARLLRSSVSLRELCEAGVAVQRLVVGGQATGLYGRLVVTLVSRGQHGADLAAHNITSGDIVELRTTQADLDQCSGVVTKVTSSSTISLFSARGSTLTHQEEVVSAQMRRSWNLLLFLPRLRNTMMRCKRWRGT